MRHHDRHRSILSAIALFAVYLSLLPVIQGLHYLKNPHIWCPEHHLIRHVRDDAAQQGDEVFHFDTVEQSSPRTVPRTHIPCAVSLIGLRAVQDLVSEVGITRAPPPQVIAKVDETRAQRRWPSLTNAPKQSPPAFSTSC